MKMQRDESSQPRLLERHHLLFHLWFFRSSDRRPALTDRLTKSLSVLTDTRDIELNFVATNDGEQSEAVSVSFHKEADGKMSNSKNPNQTWLIHVSLF